MADGNGKALTLSQSSFLLRDCVTKTRSMRKLYVLMLSLAALQHSYAQDSVLQSDANPQAVAEIKLLESTLSDLIVKGRWDEYAKSLASDYVRTIGEERSGKPRESARDIAFRRTENRCHDTRRTRCTPVRRHGHSDGEPYNNSKSGSQSAGTPCAVYRGVHPP